MFNRRFLIALPLLVPVALLAACNDKPAQQSGAASGQILPGSTTDDMLPVDTLTSQPPVMAPQPGEGAPAASSSAAPSEAASDAPAEQTPAPEASATAAE